MTKEQEQEFWRNQTLIKMSDVTRDENGKFLLSQGAMERIATEYQITLEVGKVYTLKEARDFILNEEIKRREIQEKKDTEKSETSLEAIMLWFQILPRSKRGDVFFIAKELSKVFASSSFEDVKSAIKKAQEQRLISNGNAVLGEYENQLRFKSISKTIDKWNSEITNQKELAEKIGMFIYKNYTLGLRYGQLELAVHSSSISEDTKTAIISRFYELLAPSVEKKYQGIKLRGSLLAHHILENYGDLELDRIFAILEIACPELGIPNVRFEVYRINDEGSVTRFLLQASKDQLSATEIALQLQFLQSRYPKEYILRTVKDMEQNGLILPYQEIYQKLGVIGKTQPVVSDKPKSDEEEQEKPVSSKIAPKEGPKKHKIVKHEKAKTASDRKIVVARLVTAFGIISTTSLTVLFGISPVIAAKNCAASLSALMAGNATLVGILSSDFIKLLVSVSMSIAGSISWLKLSKKRRRLRKQKEILETMEIIDSEKDEESEKGGKTR